MSDDEDDAYDVYLDAALRGEAEAPDALLARHPGASDSFVARVRAIHAESQSRGPSGEAAAAGGAGAAEGRRVGDFRIVRRLGEGGMGVVFEAEQVSLGRRVALKLLRPELVDSAEALERFRREARALAGLDHPGIVGIHAAGEENGSHWLAMEFVDGRSLESLLEECAAAGTALEPPQVLRWAADLAHALHAAHECGVVHRDVKPSNVLVTRDGRALLADFGIARAETAGLPTLTGAFVGSAAYAPPEQITGETVDRRADVYGLGATLYQALTGRPAFEGRTVDHVIHQVLRDPPAPPSRKRPDLSRDIDLVLSRALAKDRERRYPTAEEFALDLENVLAFRPVSARPPTFVERARDAARRRPGVAGAVATAAVLLVAVAISAAVRSSQEARRRRDGAAAEVSEARRLLEDHRTRHAEVLESEKTAAWTRSEMASRFLAREEIAGLDRVERDVARLHREREEVFHEVLAALRRAELLDPDVAGAARLRAEAYAERRRGALADRDDATAEFWAGLAVAAEPDGPVAREVRATGAIAVTADPPGAEVHVFVYRELADLVPDGDARRVPVPVGGLPEGVTPGAVTWIVADGDGALTGKAFGSTRRSPPLDGSSEVAPAEPHAQEVRCVPTAAALALGSTSLVGASPLAVPSLARGEHLVVVTAPGRVAVRVLVTVTAGESVSVDVRLPRVEEGIAGFVPVPVRYGNGRELIWIQRREVTAGEYRRFLSDPDVQVRIDGSERPILFPRSPENARNGGYWTRNGDGTWTFPEDWHEDWPVLGVSFDDAVAYAAWRTARSTDGVRYRLPTLDEHVSAAGEPHRPYVFGSTFRPGFAKSCFSRPKASPEPVLSYPIDESPYGVHDLCGSAAEWCDGWFDESRGLRRANFGSWGWGGPDQFAIWYANGWAPDSANGVTGFRLVAERESAR